MKKQLVFSFLFMALAICAGAQTIYRVNNEAYKANRFTREIYLFPDSTCYLKEQYADFTTYGLFKGTLRKVNDTLAEFRFRPVVSFGGNMRYSNGDSLNFDLNQTDTVLTTFAYQLKTPDNKQQTVHVVPGMNTVYVKGLESKAYSIDTRFRDPLTKKQVYLTISKESEPTLSYYGSKTPFETIPVVISGNKLTIYPNRKYSIERETFVLIAK